MWYQTQGPCLYHKLLETEGQVSNSPGGGQGGAEFHIPGGLPQLSPSGDYFMRGKSPKEACGRSVIFYARLIKQKKLCQARRTPVKGTNSTVVMRPGCGIRQAWGRISLSTPVAESV